MTSKQMDATLDRFEREPEKLALTADDPAAVERFYTLEAEWDAFAPEAYEAIEASKTK